MAARARNGHPTPVQMGAQKCETSPNLAVQSSRRCLSVICSPTSSGCAARWTSCSATSSTARWAARRGGFSPGGGRLLRGRPAAGGRARRARRHRPGRDRPGDRGARARIAGHRRPADAEGRVYQQLEIDFGPFRRTIPLGADVVADEAKADLPRRHPAHRAAARRSPSRRSRTAPRCAARRTRRGRDRHHGVRRGQDVEIGAAARFPATCPCCRCARPSRCPTR